LPAFYHPEQAAGEPAASVSILCRRRRGAARVGSIEARPLEDDRYRTERASRLLPAKRAWSHRLILEALPHIEVMLAAVTSICVSGHV